MGWLFGWTSRKSLVDHLCNDNGVKTVARYFSGNDMWAVQETPKGDRFLCLYMLRGPVEWGYKDVTEDMGPYQDTCPLSFFDMVPCPEGYAVEFRQRCRDAHARKNMKLIPGDVVLLTNGQEYTITEVGRTLRAFDNVHANMYRIPRRMLSKKIRHEHRSQVVDLYPGKKVETCACGAKRTSENGGQFTVGEWQ